MKDFIFLVWSAILLLNPVVNNSVDYISLQQMEIAYILWGLLYICTFYSKRVLISVLWILSIFYTWIWLTDKCIDFMPLWVTNVEVVVVFCIILYKTKFDKQL